MMDIRILAVGGLKEPWWQEAFSEFSKRLKPFAKVAVIEVEPEAITGSVTAEQSMRAEGERLLKRLPDDGYVIALERTGSSLASPALAELLSYEGGAGRPLVFVIGGAAGLDRAVLERADKKVSFSAMTFTHEMARVILIEQIYRVMTILAGKKYHY
ncbi:MAG: 23S rRNA (pseudouridine(1915)-N(3))-methyltransferase RlmH [Patescibacteria group bacterium]